MELTYNNGNTFFNLISEDFIGLTTGMKNVNKMIAKDVISFSITEEVGKLITGTLSLRDKTGVYSKVFRNGVKFNISWGYKKWNTNVADLTSSSLLSSGVRQGLKCVVQTPSGQGTESGEVLYNATFYGLEFLEKKKNRVFERGIIYDVISQCLKEMDCNNYIIDFAEQNRVLRKTYSFRQREPNYTFLVNMARSFNCHYQMGYSLTGKKIAVFVDSRKIDKPHIKKFIRDITGSGDEKALYYNSGSLSNVKNFSWQQHIGENGQGDGTTITYVEGKPVFSRFVVESGSVTLWKLDEQKVRDYIHSKGNIRDEAQAVMQIVNAKKFEEVKQFFYKDDTPYSPQGQGFTINCAMHGDPMLTGLLKIVFKNGFPAPLQQSETIDALLNFYVRRVVHTFNKQEYSCDVEVCDTFTLNGSYVAPENMAEAIR